MTSYKNTGECLNGTYFWSSEMVIVEKINEEKRKLEVMVKIFGRKTPLELSYMQVEKED